ncbi:hypothetical protein M9H77_02288 [Catharanthus roseus]|uniref:Uncharacterized protein n=1 Tax=Catharanthus roseus TaxID=4058 RepID=A0ACC0C806_CATRO|nr:hypothetical protein M9H77_02288 [Catharanthus roseus]
MGLLSKKNEVPSRSRNDEKQMRTDENRVKTMKMEAVGKTKTYSGRISSFVQDLLSLNQELKALIQDFDLRLGDWKDDLRRHYSQGCLKLKKEEQSMATNRGLTGAID